jgi:murein DD-endopeptidase MepM/ murein hydrolase activator NlpD
MREACLHFSQNDYKFEVDVDNGDGWPVSVRIEFDKLSNVLADRPIPAEVLVPAGERARLVKLVVRNARRSASFPYRWRLSFGDPHAKHDERARYRMPFGGSQARELSQGVNGRFSHKGAHRHSFDFAMPTGTPILAARAGRIVHVADGYTEAGTSEEFLPAANAVTVLHEDGTFATYAHLDPGAGVRVGMHVLTGELLGFSGNTGYSTGPHLHFSVWRGSYQGQTTLPIRFYNGKAHGFVPRERRVYAPGCHDEGRACLPGERPRESYPAKMASPVERAGDGTCRCSNGAVITTHLPCRAVCP